jgi:hypothetical protein
MTQPDLNDLFDVPLEVFLADPYPFYRRLRSEAPVFWDERSRVWILTRVEWRGIVSLRALKALPLTF